MSLKFEIREPSTETERWRILRQPFGRPRYSGEYESGTIHLAAWLNGRAIGAGRVYLDSPEQAHVRGMAVEPALSRQGIGGAIIAELERRSKERGAKRIVVESREAAVSFYEKQGYRIVGECSPDFHPVRHFRLTKEL